MIRHLSRQGHNVIVASLTRSDEESREAQGIRDYCDEFIFEQVSNSMAVLRMVGSLSTTSPASMGYFYSPRLKSRIDALLAEQSFDLIFVHCSSVAPYVADVLSIPKILDFGDMDSQKWLIYSKFRPFPMSMGYRLESTKLQQAEVALAQKFDFCTCTTKAELNTLNSYGVSVPTDWFPNGVDTEYFRPTEEPYDPDVISFIGRMDYYPNQQCMLSFCKDVMPAICKRRPGTKLWIVGANPSKAIQTLGRLSNVTVTGSVEDVRPYVYRSAVNVAPLTIARGTQNKVLEAMAMGVPVVTSEQAAGGVDAVPNEHFLTASTIEGYRDAVLRLLESPKDREQFARRGRARMLSHHNWENSMNQLSLLIEKCLAASSC
jgi:sugar transferase (PEP-CTERM/EpsH1 system associated)